VWWLRLGIAIERIRPGCPQQNGRHERMHLTLKKEATKPPCYNFLQQQDRFDRFITVYNHERPHQALGGRYPAELYTIPEYPFHERSIRVTQCGRICIRTRKIQFSRAFAGQYVGVRYVGVREVSEGIWLVSFMSYDLGFFDETENRVEPIGENPFAPKL